MQFKKEMKREHRVLKISRTLFWVVAISSAAMTKPNALECVG